MSERTRCVPCVGSRAGRIVVRTVESRGLGSRVFGVAIDRRIVVLS